MCPLGSANGAYVLPFLVCAELIAKRENAKRLLLFPEDRSTARGGCKGAGGRQMLLAITLCAIIHAILYVRSFVRYLV